MRKFKVKMKDSTGKWQTYGYGTEWDNGKKNITLSFKKDYLVKLLSDIELGIIPVNQGYISGSLWEEEAGFSMQPKPQTLGKHFNVPQNIKQPTQEEINKTTEMMSDIPF